MMKVAKGTKKGMIASMGDRPWLVSEPLRMLKPEQLDEPLQ